MALLSGSESLLPIIDRTEEKEAVLENLALNGDELVILVMDRAWKIELARMVVSAERGRV